MQDTPETGHFVFEDASSDGKDAFGDESESLDQPSLHSNRVEYDEERNKEYED